ncbi:proline-rich protein 3-like [Molossus molossus]|uniref:proline-rich protein 3-like n=1 Tax=Molossus molossus TaxID=27622 RepID=UPI001746E6AC|nr:proline-rich protein 3-like [Molossus molossus]
MPKRKKQNQQQQQQLPQPQGPKRVETGEEDVGSLSALHRGPLGSRALMIPPLLSLPPPQDRGPVSGGLGPRSDPYGCGRWGISAEPPFPRGHSSPSRRCFPKEQRHPGKFKSWSLIKNACPSKGEPQVMEDKSDCPIY